MCLLDNIQMCQLENYFILLVMPDHGLHQPYLEQLKLK